MSHYVAPAYGEIYGVPQPGTAGSYTARVTATDATGAVSTVDLSFNVSVLSAQYSTPAETVGSPYNEPIRVLGGTGGYSAALIDGVLPAGLVVNSGPVSITGTPLENSGNSPVLRITDSTSPIANTLRVSIGTNITGGSGSTVSINGNGYYGYLLYSTVGNGYSNQLQACCIPSYVWSLVSGSLPPGISFSQGGVLSGSTPVAGKYAFIVSASDPNNAANIAFRQYVFTVSPLAQNSPGTLPFANVGSAYSTSLLLTGATGATNWTVGYDTALPAGLSLNASTGVLSGTPAVPGTYSFTVLVWDTTNIPSVRSYNLSIYPAGVLPPLGLSFNPNITATLGQFTQQLNATGGTAPYHYSATPGATPIPGFRVLDGQPLPNGYNTANGTGSFAGVSTQPGSWSTSIRVTDAQNRTFDWPFTLTVSPLVMYSQAAAIPKAMAGVPYSFQFQAGGGSGTYVYTSNNLPTGMSLNASTGVLSGTPPAAGTFGFTVQLSNSSVSGSVGFGFNLTVNAFAITNAPVLPQGTIGTPYTQTFTAPGCGTGCTWTLFGGLPNGFVLNSSTGVLTGTPNSAFFGSATVQASSNGSVVQKVFTLTVPPAVISPPVITNSFGATNAVGTGQAVQLNASGGTPPYTWAVTAGSLPTGISLTSTTGENLGAFLSPGFYYLFGRATQVGTFKFTLQVTDANNRAASKDLTWQISLLALNYTNLPLNGSPLILNQPYSQNLLVLGGSGNYTSWVSTLPPAPIYPGLTMNAATGLISGTPANTGSVSTPIQVSDDANNSLVQILNISATSNGTTTVTVQGGPGAGSFLLPASTSLYTLFGSGGTAPYTFSALTAIPSGFALLTGNSSPLPGNAYLQTSPVAAGPYSFTIQAVDANGVIGVRTYTGTVLDFPLATTTLPDASVNVPYSQPIYLGGGAVVFAVSPGSVLPAGLSLSAKGLLSGTPTQPGTYQFSVICSDASGSFTYTTTLNVSGLALVMPTLLPNASVSVPYSIQLQATGGLNLTWTATSVPSGLTLSPSGLLSGTPTGASFPANISVTVAGGGMSLTRRFTLYILNSPSGPLSVANPNLFTGLPDATLNVIYSAALAPSGGMPPYALSLAAGAVLPPGMSIVSVNPLTGVQGPTLVGSPTVVGNYSFAVTITDAANNTATHTFKLNVTPLVFNNSGLPTAIVGQPYSHQIPVLGGAAPYSFSFTPTNQLNEMFPPGLTVSASGLISGTPLSSGSFSFYAVVQDAAGHTRGTGMTLSSTNGNGLYVSVGNTANLVGASFTQTLTTSGSSTYTWSVTTGALPPGLSIQGNKLVGTLTTPDPATPVAAFTNPMVPRGYQFLLRATDNANSANYAERWITISVTPILLAIPDERSYVGSGYLPAATAGTPYSYTFKAAGGTGPYTFTETPLFGLPQGMTVSPAGVLSGTPVDAGSFNLRLQITDATGEFRLTSSFVLLVAPVNGKAPLVVGPAFLNTASVGQPYAMPVSGIAGGGVAPITWSLAQGSSLPAGLSLVNGPGVSSWIVGIPTVPGNSTVTLVATDNAGQSGSVQVPVNVSPLALTGAIPVGFVGSPYSAVFTPSGGTGPYNIQILGSIPGLTLNGGTLSGTPLYSGSYRLSLVLTDSANNTFSRVENIWIDDAAGQAPSISGSPNPINIVYVTGSGNLSVPLTISATSGSIAFNAGVLGLGNVASLSAITGTTSGSPLSLSINGGNAVPGVYSGVLALDAAQAINNFIGVPVSLTVIAPPPCTYTLSPGSSSALTTGGSGTFNVAAGSGCAWSAAPDSSSSWIAVNGATSGSGNGTVSYTVAANTAPAQRIGAITVANQTFSVTQFGQNCSFAISPASLNLTNSGGQVAVNVISSAAGCHWPASSGLGVVLPAQTVGNGQVQITVPANALASTVNLTATIAGQTLNVTEGGASCNFTLSSASATFSSGGGQGTVTVSGPQGCAYNTVSGPGWISITSGGSGTLDASGQALLTYTVAPGSTTLGRSSTLLIGGQTYQIAESGLACSISLDASALGFPFGTSAGTGVINVAANGANCQWAATSNSPFVTVSPAAGSGNGTVNVTVTSNTASTAARNGSVSINGQTVTFSQAGTTCNFLLRSTMGSLPALGGSGSVSVVAANACAWTAASNVAWATVTPASSNGTADVQFTVKPNTTAQAQTGTLTIAGQTFTITQQAASCSYSLASGSANFANTGNTGSVAYTGGQSGCSPAPVSYANWLAVAPSSSFSGTAGILNYSVAPNGSAQTRTGVVQIGDQVFTVTQTGAACAFSLSSYGASYNSQGGAGIVLGTASVANGCNPNPAVSQPFVVLSGAPANLNTYTFTQGFTVTPFVTPAITTRRGLLSFGNQLFAIKQTSY